MTNSPINGLPVADEESWEESYDRVLPDLEALTEDELIPVNLEINSATTTARGIIPKLAEFRDELARLPDFDLAAFDKLADYTRALSYANLLHASSVAPPDHFKTIQERVVALRETFLSDLGALSRRGLVNAEAYRDIRGPNGYKNLVHDLALATLVLRKNWANVAGKCGTSAEELEEAENLVALTQGLLGERERTPTVATRTANIRSRAFTLFTKTYDDARRAISFLRWHHRDIDTIAPSLYSGRSNGRKREREEPDHPIEEMTLVPPPAKPTPASAPRTLAIGSATNGATNRATIERDEGPFVE